MPSSAWKKKMVEQHTRSIIRIEKSIDFFPSHDLPTEYDFDDIEVDDPIFDAEVAVVDTGIYTKHPLLSKLLIEAEDCIRDSTKEDLSNGTFVAGIVIFWNEIENQIRTLKKVTPVAKVFDIKVLKKHLYPTSDKEILEAILKVVNNPAHRNIKVFNLSLNNEGDQSLLNWNNSHFTR